MSTQNVNVARFARNVEWDFFCDFQTPCKLCRIQPSIEFVGNIGFKKIGEDKAVQVGSSHVFVLLSVRSYVVRLLYRLLFDTYLIKHISTRLIQQDDVRLYQWTRITNTPRSLSHSKAIFDTARSFAREVLEVQKLISLRLCTTIA